MAAEALVEVRGLVKHFPMSSGFLAKKKTVLQAVDGISFRINRGETLGLVGESGCGKTTAGRTMLRLYEPTAGEMLFEGKDVFQLSDAEMLEARRHMQMIFQDPYSSLNPRMTVGDIIGEPLDIHRLANGKERTERVYELLSVVRLSKEHSGRFPHEFSGGQRQRIGFARALAVAPSFIVCDEPISALDVSIQAQMVNLLQEMQEKLGLTYLFIAHDLSMVKHISNRVAVMYLGKIVELAESTALYKDPLHPYTQALLSAIPVPDPDVEAKRQRVILEGDVPSPINPPSGCHFRTRCRHAMPVCAEQEPEFREQASGHHAACWLLNKA